MSDNGYSKIKPSYINNENCLKNAIKRFPLESNNWVLILDNTSDTTNKMVSQYVPINNIVYCKVGHGAGTFNLALDIALKLPTDEIVYFIENDYIHRSGSKDCILDILNGVGAHYATLYNHPDKFMPPQLGGNPEVDIDGGWYTKLYYYDNEYYYMPKSTTMTFATRVDTLWQDQEILRKYTKGTYPEDYKMFLELSDKGKALLCPVDSKSTHAETMWLAGINGKGNSLLEVWEKCLDN
jgi:hypothetical protein